MKGINEIKKALYREKPLAYRARLTDQGKLPDGLKDMDIYLATVTVNGFSEIVEFRIPWSDKPESGLQYTEPAQHLIRWLVK